MKFNKNPEDYRCLITHTFANMYERIGRTSKIGFSNISTIDNLPFNLGTYETDIPSRIDRNCFENTKDAVMKEDVLHCKRLIKIKSKPICQIFNLYIYNILKSLIDCLTDQ